MQDQVQPTLKVRQIVSGPNHRTYYDPRKMAELEEGLVAAGRVTQPIQVRPHPTQASVWEIIAGERRWRAAGKLFGDDYDMPVVISDASDAEVRALGIIENHYRDNPSDVEQARGAADLLQFNRGDKEQTAKQLGWGLETLERRLLLLNCAADVQAALVERRIKLGHAELLAGLPQDRQVKVLAGVLEHKVPVEVLKKQLGQFAKRLADAIFDTALCIGCPHNSAQQAALFDETIGEGFCQHPTHFDELTMAALEAKAVPLREQYPVVRIVRAADAFVPLPVGPDGELGVGTEQYADCKACANFGCSVSAVPGSYGSVDESLCFDAQCHSTKVAERRRAERDAAKAATAASDASEAPRSAPAQRDAPAPAAKAQAKHTSNQTPARVAQYRTERWRTWVANRLMADPSRNHRVLAALIASSSMQAFNPLKFTEAASKLATAKFGTNGFKGALELADNFDLAKLPAIVQAVTASAAYGVSQSDLEVLLNYLEVDEARHFKLCAEYLELLTVSELESLADELKLRKAMGDSAFKKARAGTKAKFIDALLNVEGFEYAGAVPKALRYPRRKYRFCSDDSSTANGAPTPAGAQSDSADAIEAAA
ncbi:PRTRC system ParB family protein [uncultured Methylibium sp.]|uniref:PRTRC system ParB family protein n=1 Tax=uncultured Methylibium sp. TaxID=381093 RepID=UPI0025F34FBA|nr:PRTRC system ParB family protein [uncultured Methylibium sp.]